MRRRPTIPFSLWRIAVDLEQTKNIQNQKGMPAYQCQCELCKIWKEAYSNIIPPKTLDELNRLGVQIDAPNELYRHSSSKEKSTVRAIYHIVGKILSGPPKKIFHKGLNEQISNLLPIRENPYFSVRVVNASDLFDKSPVVEHTKDNNVIAIDFWFEM